MTQERVIYNGHEMAAEWPARIEAAQDIPEYNIGGRVYRRIPYGEETDGPFPEPCHDCGVLHGQLHVELCCDMEECPRCGGQVIGCDCPYDGDEETPPEDDSPPADARPAAHWSAILGRIRQDLGERVVFLETAARRLLPLGPAREASVTEDAVALVVPCRPPDSVTDPMEPARELAATLANRHNLDAIVLVSRDPETFVGYYVRISC
jgi:hypothetical protein